MYFIADAAALLIKRCILGTAPGTRASE